MNKADWNVIDGVFESLPSLRELTADEQKVAHKVKLIIQQIETSEAAQQQLEQIRNELNSLN